MTPPIALDRCHLDFALTLQKAIEDHTAPSDGGDTPTAPPLLWSPYSVASALGLAAAGARGETRDELAAALAPGGDLAAQGRLLARSARPEGADAAVANALWIRAGLRFDEGYRNAVLDWPGGALHSADFAGAPEAARQEINADVADTTRGLIKDLLAPGDIHPAVVAVIVNALYLKVAWRMPFPTSATAPAPFHAPSGTREVPTMRQTERMRYAAVDGWRMVTLDTAGELAVDIVLPDPADASPATGAAGADPAGPRVSRDVLLRLHENAAVTKVALSLPRLRIEDQTALDTPLRRVGVARAFTDEADFSGITAIERLWIDRVVHKAVLTVDEEGFEGAAATALVMRTVSFDLDPPVEFRVDRPFLLFVRHSRTGALFFSTRVTEP